MEKCRVNVCCFCFRPGIKFHQSEDCIEPAIHARFDGTTELRNALKKILKNYTATNSKTVCVRCNDGFQRIYTFMDRCFKSVSPPVENTLIRITKPKTIAGNHSIGQSSQLNTSHRKEDHDEGNAAKSCEEGSQISKLKKLKKAVVRLNRLKMTTFTVKVRPECDRIFCYTTENSRAENDSVRNACDVDFKDLMRGECPQIEDIKSEILEDIHTEDYQAIETSNASRNLVQRFLPKEESIGNANTPHLEFSSDQSDRELDKADNLNLPPNEQGYKHGSSSNKRYKCDHCQKMFVDLETHLLLHKSGALKCEQCGKDFRDNFSLQQHKKIHGKRNKHKCDQCEKEYISPYALKEHQRLHNGNRVVCDLCGANFGKNSQLRWHKSKEHSHSNERYKCDQCDKDFSKICYLRYHQETHAGTIFNCNHCGTQYRSRYLLGRHTHNMHGANSLKLNKCEQCEKIFKTSVGLKRHILSTHLNITYPCDMCNKKFRSKGTMSTHRRLHIGSSFDCQHCDKRFVQKCRLHEHEAKFHQKHDMPANVVVTDQSLNSSERESAKSEDDFVQVISDDVENSVVEDGLKDSQTKCNKSNKNSQALA